MKNMLTQIHEDMPVYDRTGKKIGAVKNVQFGDEDLERPGVETSTAEAPAETDDNIVDYVAEVFATVDRIPEEFRKRLQRYGYIQVDTGLLTSDRFASSDQIANVTTDRVDLSVTKDELIKS
jgi:hypothetical protein